ncbi:hypothetical protein [Cognatilysobacter tabacisoli]|uniref:hypothetical protein n=1 Tax=Cognatilysobacter tabacisoli TaxID=2315424 RepID=UPI000E6AEAD3|nr:hypothetical protein [Lysobacter tabacisoli]
MNEQVIGVEVSEEELTAIDVALSALESNLKGLIALSADQRRGMVKMGGKSEAFCRQAVTVFTQHPDVLPRNFDLDQFRRNLEMLDALRPRLSRISRLHERSVHSQMALGSSLMSNALDGYAVMKVAGIGKGLDGMRRILGARFGRVRSREVENPLPKV